MSDSLNRQIVLKSRPAGEPSEDNFALIESPIPEPAGGQFLARTLYLSLDPYMRGRLSDAARGMKLGSATVRQIAGSGSERWLVSYERPDGVLRATFSTPVGQARPMERYRNALTALTDRRHEEPWQRSARR